MSALNDTAAADDRPIWNVRAERVAQQVLGEVMDGIDAIPAASLLIAVLRAEVGELPADDTTDLDATFRLEEGDESSCICPPGLVERGGFRGGCRVHAGLPDGRGTASPP